jgi:N-acetyl-gamma-glutamyl-phosphate reductase
MNAGIIGATGYAGAEIARLLAMHPEIERLRLSSTSFEGEAIAGVYPNFLGRLDAKLEKTEDIIHHVDVVFGALPNGLAENYAGRCIQRGIPFIDMSADFRFDDDEETYTAWYGQPYKNRELHKSSIYGLCELNRAAIEERAAKDKALVIGNPGCYPTCASLAVWPALAKGIAGSGTIIIDAASGITGGGREPQRSFHFPECNDTMTPYKVGAHRHTPEIARNFNMMESRTKNHPVSEDWRQIIFTPHLAPMNRGILATLYIPLSERYRARGSQKDVRPPSKEIEETSDSIRDLYREFYRDEQFVRVLPKGLYAATSRVKLSNYCDIAVNTDQAGTTLVVSAAIDNMVKGAAGQAVQNMNIIFGFAENTGLGFLPALF